MKPWGFKTTIFLALLVNLAVISGVYADTAITDVFVINETGNYSLNNNITCSNGTAILITCSNVVLDGKGFYLDGNNSGIHGIYISKCENVTIKNVNVVDFKKYGIYLGSSDHNTITNNNVSSNGHGIRIHDYSNHNTITNNNVSSNGHGIMLSLHSDHNTITNNTANQNSGDDYNPGTGLYLKDFCMSNTLTGNTVGGNDFGIYLEKSLVNKIYNNIFNNTNNAYSTNQSNSWNTLKELGGGNYWFNSTGPGFSETTADRDGDGFCDMPYPIASNNIDYLPILWDNTAPEVAINSPDNTIYWENSVLVNVTVTDKLSAISSVIAEIDGVKNVTLTADGDYFTGNTENISNGNHIIKIIANDTAGNVNSSETVEFEISIIKEYDLLNENGESFGTITVNARGDFLYFTYNLTKPGWIISELHLMALNETPTIGSIWYDGGYMTKTENPKVGQFEISEKSGIDSEIYSGTLNLTEYVGEPLDTLYISAHTKICNESSLEYLDLWIDGNNFPGSGWATYVEYP